MTDLGRNGKGRSFSSADHGCNHLPTQGPITGLNSILAIYPTRVPDYEDTGNASYWVDGRCGTTSRVSWSMLYMLG